MKKTGYTLDHKVVVEMSEDEFTEFHRLSKAVMGSDDISELYRPDFGGMYEYDFKDVFSVIRAFYTANFRLNELQGLLDDFKAAINEPNT